MRLQRGQSTAPSCLLILDKGRESILIARMAPGSRVVTLQDYREEQRERHNRTSLAALDPAKSDATVASLPNASPPVAASTKGRVVKASMMSGAQGLTFTGGHFSNVGGNINRGGRNRAASPGHQAPQLVSSEVVAEEITEAAFLENASYITAKGPGVRLDNAGGTRQSGKSGSVHAHMFTNLKISEFHSGTFTNAGGTIDGEEFEDDDQDIPVAVPDVVKEGALLLGLVYPLHRC